MGRQALSGVGCLEISLNSQSPRRVMSLLTPKVLVTLLAAFAASLGQIVFERNPALLLVAPGVPYGRDSVAMGCTGRLPLACGGMAPLSPDAMRHMCAFRWAIFHLVKGGMNDSS